MPFYLQMSKNITDPRDIYDSYISILTNLLRTDNETKSEKLYTTRLIKKDEKDKE